MNATKLYPALLLALAMATSAQAQTVAFTGATLWDGTGASPTANATLLVRDGRIVSVGALAPPEGATVVDLSGQFIIPGLINAHGHVTGYWASEEITDPAERMAEDLRLYARYGVTTVASLGGAPPEAAAVRASQGELPLTRARLLYAGPVVVAQTEGEAREAVRAVAAQVPDWIKIRVDDNLGTTDPMPWEAVASVFAEADARGLPVATHLYYLADAKRLLDMGSDLIAHSVRDQPVDDELITALRRRDVCYVPTLTRELSTFAYSSRPPFLDDPFFTRYAKGSEIARVTAPAFMQQMRESRSALLYRQALPRAQANLKTLVSAGVRVAMGTDSGPAARFPGYFEHLELALMAEAGLSAEEILRSATGVAADCLSLNEVGTLEPGKWADFVVLQRDPLADVANTRSLDAVYIAGQQIR
jgi:imidazolonepropionase-like amidohydrolase